MVDFGVEGVNEGRVIPPLNTMEYIYEADGHYSKTLNPPLLMCKNCKAVIMPGNGQTVIRCRCGEVYRLITFDGRQVKKLPLK